MATPNNCFQLDRRISSPSQSMSSTHMYNQAFPCVDDLKGKLNQGLSKANPTATTKGIPQLCEGSVADNTDLNFPELSFDLQDIIGPDSGHPVTNLDESSAFVPDIVLNEYLQIQFPIRHQNDGGRVPNRLQHQQQHKSVYSFGRYPMPQQSAFGTDHYGAEAALTIMREPIDHIDLSSSSQRPYTYGSSIYSCPAITERQTEVPLGTAPVLRGHLPINRTSLPSASPFPSHHNGGHLKRDIQNSQTTSNKRKNKKNNDIHKSSDEYRRRRERNNIAVRKSREKERIIIRETERKISEMERGNDVIRKRIECMSREFTVLKNVMSDAGLSSDAIEVELAKILDMDQDQLRGLHM